MRVPIPPKRSVEHEHLMDKTVRLPPHTASARHARQFVHDAIEGSSPVDGMLSVLVSELASNAILHAKTDFTVRVRDDADVLRVEVTDFSAVAPTKKDYGPDAITGRGLQLVESVADRWGVELLADGKTVWFELDRVDAGATP